MCVRPRVCPSAALGEQLLRFPVHVRRDALLPGSRPVPAPHVSGPGLSQEARWEQPGVLREGRHT